MIFVKQIEVANFGPYKGAQRCSLSEGVHAVVASTEDDPDRSNWVGKSWFLSTIPFSLFGWHMARTEDDFINWDSKGASVTIELSNGAVIKRSRMRGKSTQLTFTPRGGMTQAGDGAQATILSMLGMSEDDYFATSFAKQKEIARIITGGPADRLKMVRGWLELDPLEKSEGIAWAKAVAAQDELAKLSEPEKAFDAFWVKLAALGIEDEPALVAATKAAEEEVKAASAAVSALLDEKAKLDNLNAVDEASKRFTLLDTEGRELRAKLDAMPEVTAEQIAEARQRVQEAIAAHGPARSDAARAGTASRGEFNGTCPVAGIACPAKDQINTASEESRRHLTVVTEHAAKLGTVVTEAQAELTRLSDAKLLRDRTSAKLDGLRQQAQAMLDLSKRKVEAVAESETPLVERARLAQERLSEAGRRLAMLQTQEQERARLVAALPSVAAIGLAKRKVTAARATAKIWGKVQQMVSEGAMEAIGKGTNAALVDAGIDLKVDISWAREGDGLASTCEECGSPFPKSAKVKECSWCGAKRGPKLVERLDIEPSDRSGAADDLAGICFRLAASAWRREKKSIQWANACIDEPFGALDMANRRALASHLTTMLGGRYGFVQTFVVAHDRAITDGLPKRIELVGTREGTRFG
jgi:DNA repair exonuclease SbcCD ATPase subunit